MSTRARESQLDLPSLRALIQEVEDARGGFPTLKARLDALVGSGGGGSEIGYATSGVTEERLDLLASIVRAANHARSEYYVGKTLVVDPLTDLSGIDISLSSGYIWQSQRIQQAPRIPDWVEFDAPEKPPARRYHSLTFDPIRGRAILFGGVGQSGLLNDTWEYDGTNWTRITTPTSPPARQGHSLTFDPIRGRVILFGGYDGSTRFNDTWEYDGTNWTRITTPTSPPARSGHSLTFDPIRGRAILFGGFGSSSLNDTWEYDGTNWIQVQTPTSPPARQGHSLTFDPIRGRAILFGGVGQSGRPNDTWELVYPSDQVIITTKPIETERPPKGVGVIQTIGGNASAVKTFVSLDDGATWKELSTEKRVSIDDLPNERKLRLRFEWTDATVNLYSWGVTWDYGLQPLSGGGSYADDLAFQNAINLAKTNFKLNTHIVATRERLAGLIIDVFSDTSGIDDQMSRVYGYDAERKEVHALTDLVWEEKTIENPPPARNYHSLTFDPIRGRVILFGGHTGSTYLNDTWEYDGTNWIQIQTPTSPPARNLHSLTFDPIRGRVILFGGWTGSSRLNDTWEYDGSTWTQIQTPTSPPARSSHSLTFDPIRGRVILFGGLGSSYLNDTWEYDGTNWIQIQTPTSPPARQRHSLTFDSIRGRVILFGGFNGSSRLNDTWEYDGTNWTRITTPTSPSAREYHSLTFDPIRSRVILFGGYTGSSRLNDTWEYDGSTWTQIQTPTSPPARYQHALTFDPIRGRAILFGGYASGYLNDTWEYWDNIDPAEVVSSADELELPPSQVYFVPHIPDDAPLSNIEYYMSLDGGQTWFPIKPEELMSVSGGINISNPPLIRVKAIIPSGGRLSGWAYGWV